MLLYLQFKFVLYNIKMDGNIHVNNSKEKFFAIFHLE